MTCESKPNFCIPMGNLFGSLHALSLFLATSSASPLYSRRCIQVWVKYKGFLVGMVQGCRESGLGQAVVIQCFSEGRKSSVNWMRLISECAFWVKMFSAGGPGNKAEGHEP